jgi:hypothetical protein
MNIFIHVTDEDTHEYSFISRKNEIQSNSTEVQFYLILFPDNVQCKAIPNCHNEFPIYNEYILIKNNEKNQKTFVKELG